MKTRLLPYFTLALSVPVVFLMVDVITKKLNAPTPLIADEVPLGARLLMDALGLTGALIGIFSSARALKGEESYARALPLLTVLLAALLAIILYTRSA